MQDPSLSLDVPLWAWLLFGVVILAGLVVDLVVHRGGRSVGRGAAIGWSIAWISVALLWAGWVALQFGADVGVDFVTAWLIEKSLSVDNMFLFVVLFAQLRIPSAEQHRVLFWGILGALISRAVFIASGATLLSRWHGAVYVLGAFLIYTGVKTARSRPAPADGSGEGDGGRVLAFLRRHLPFTSQLHGHRFVVVEAGRRVATPLLLAVIAVEATDIMFAVDSVPAVLAVSNAPFIVYSSNVFAVLGLRALYLVLASGLKDMRYLHFGLAGILVLAGGKMVLSSVLHVPHLVSLAAIALILIASIVPSVIARRAVAARARSSEA